FRVFRPLQKPMRGFCSRKSPGRSVKKHRFLTASAGRKRVRPFLENGIDLQKYAQHLEQTNTVEIALPVSPQLHDGRHSALLLKIFSKIQEIALA
ncbi:MAG: hypothetical protein ACOX88_05220, partial [Christensenellales bacterium]